MAAAALTSLAGLAATVPGAISAPTQTRTAATEAQAGVRGTFSALMMIHQTSNGNSLPGVNAWDGSYREGKGFIYRSIPCTGNAPVNNISSDLPSYGTRVPGSRAPSSMRAHPIGFQVRKIKGRWEISGSMRFTVCQLAGGATPASDPVPDAEKPQIVVGFRAQFKRETDELVRWTGRFRIEGGTQRYADLTGSGQISGYFMCFAPQGCAATGGKYLDGQMALSGTYSDPTPQLGS